MTWIFTLVGITLNLIVLRDMFQTLFAPSGSGSLSSMVAKGVWSGFRSIARQKPDRLNLSGPLSVLIIIAIWTLGITVGWACVLWPHLPEQFLLSTGMNPEDNDGFLDAIYLSSVTLATLGYGDITPQATWIRLSAPLEALLGFSLFTASITWVMSIYPALSRRRCLARNISVLHRSQKVSGISLADLDANAASDVLQSFTSQIIAVRDDFSQIPISYYFRTSDPEASLEVTLPILLALARAAAEDPADAVRLHATVLLGAIQHLTAHLSTSWLHADEDTDMSKVLEMYEQDHLRETAAE